MRLLDNRKLVLRCYKGFKKFVFPNIGTATKREWRPNVYGLG